MTTTYQALENALASGGAARHHIPDLVFELAKFQPLLHFLWAHGYRRISETQHSQVSMRLTPLDILLVGKDKQQRLLHFPVQDDSV